LHSIVTVESGYNPQAVSPKGAIGLMQVIPATGERFGVSRLDDPRQNLRAGARYLRFLLSQFNNDLPLVIAAYNAGEGRCRNTATPFHPMKRRAITSPRCWRPTKSAAAAPTQPAWRHRAARGFCLRPGQFTGSGAVTTHAQPIKDLHWQVFCCCTRQAYSWTPRISPSGSARSR
jgi:membrane-bound lytic murein transglycosylase MltF